MQHEVSLSLWSGLTIAQTAGRGLRLSYWAECSCNPGQKQELRGYDNLCPYISEEHCGKE